MIHMKCQALFSLKINLKNKIDCYLLQFCFAFFKERFITENSDDLIGSTVNFFFLFNLNITSRELRWRHVLDWLQSPVTKYFFLIILYGKATKIKPK